jgi:hypothetical protein
VAATVNEQFEASADIKAVLRNGCVLCKLIQLPLSFIQLTFALQKVRFLMR